MAKRPPQKPQLPTEAEVLDFIQSSPSIVGKREISRHFDVNGRRQDRPQGAAEAHGGEGLLAKRQRKLIDRSSLPPVTVLEIIGTDKDGEAYAEPVEWDERQAGKPPRVVIEGAEKAPRKGDRVLAKIQPSRDGRYKFRGRVIKALSDRSNKVLGVYRVLPGLGARIVPVDKKARHELQVMKGDENGALNGELVEAEIISDRGHGLPSARVRERLGDMNDQRNISLIAIHHHGIPNEFPERVLRESESLKPFAARGPHRPAQTCPSSPSTPRDARDHDDAVWAEIDEATGGANVIVAIADVAAYVRPGTALDREARIRGNSVYFPDRVVPMLPERISNDLCSLREKEERPALACFMSFDKSGRKTKHRFERVIMRSAAKLAYEEAQAAIDGKPNDKTEPLLEGVLKPLWARLWHPAQGPQRPRAPGTRPARAQADPRRPWPDRARGDARAPRRPQAGRGVHDPGQCRRRRGTGEPQDAADLPRPRPAVRGEGPGAGRIPPHRGHDPAAGPGHAAQAFQQVAEGS